MHEEGLVEVVVIRVLTLLRLALLSLLTLLGERRRHGGVLRQVRVVTLDDLADHEAADVAGVGVGEGSRRKPLALGRDGHGLGLRSRGVQGAPLDLGGVRVLRDRAG